MSPLDVQTIRRKLSLLVENLRLLEPTSRLSLEAWLSDRDVHDASERRLQLVIEAAIDVNAHLLVGAGHPAPTDAYRSFLEVAGRLRVVPPDLAARLAPSAGLRNRLVHRYDELDDERVWRGMQDAVANFPAYVDAVDRYLTTAAVRP